MDEAFSKVAEKEELTLARAALLEMMTRLSLSVRSFMRCSRPQVRQDSCSALTRRGILTEIIRVLVSSDLIK